MLLTIWICYLAVVVHSLTMQVSNYGTSFNDHKVYENTQIQMIIRRTGPGNTPLTLTFSTSNPSLAQLASTINPSPIKIYFATYVYFIINSDNSIRGSQNVTFFVSSDSTSEPSFALNLTIYENDGKSIALNMPASVMEGKTLTCSVKRTWVDDIISVTMSVEDEHPTHITFTPNPIVFDLMVDTVEVAVSAPDNDCFDSQDLTLKVIASSPNIGSSIRYLQYVGNDVAQVTIVAGQYFLSPGQMTPITIQKNFYDVLVVNLTTDPTKLLLTDAANPNGQSPALTSVSLPYEANCKTSSVSVMAVVVSGQPGEKVSITANAVYKTKTGTTPWQDHTDITIVNAKSDDSSPFSSKNLPSTVGSILAALVVLICLIGGGIYLRNRRKQPTSSFGRFNDDEPDTAASQSKFTIADNADAQGYLTGGGSVSTGNTDQLLPPKDSTDIELSEKVGSALSTEPGASGKPT